MTRRHEAPLPAPSAHIRSACLRGLARCSAPRSRTPAMSPIHDAASRHRVIAPDTVGLVEQEPIVEARAPGGLWRARDSSSARRRSDELRRSADPFGMFSRAFRRNLRSCRRSPRACLARPRVGDASNRSAGARSGASKRASWLPVPAGRRKRPLKTAHARARQEAHAPNPIAPPSRAVGARDGRGRSRARDGRRSRLGRGSRREQGRRRPRSAAGDAAYVIPLVLVGVGGLMLVRSALVDFRPFQTGLAVGSVGLLVALGSGTGGFLGRVLGGGLAHLIGGTGSVILGIALAARGVALVTGASAGAAAPPVRARDQTRRARAAQRSLEVFEDADGAREAARERRRRPPRSVRGRAATCARARAPARRRRAGLPGRRRRRSGSAEPPSLVAHDRGVRGRDRTRRCRSSRRSTPSTGCPTARS